MILCRREKSERVYKSRRREREKERNENNEIITLSKTKAALLWVSLLMLIMASRS